MEQLRRPLLNDAPLTTIVEADVENSTEPRAPISLPREVSSADSSEYGTVNGQVEQEGRRTGRGKKKYSTWGGKDTHAKKTRKKAKRVTNLGQLPSVEVDYPRSLKSYNIHQEGYGLDRATRVRQGSDVSSTPSTQASPSDGGEDENAFSEEEGEGGVIDTVLSMDGGHDFVDVRIDPTIVDDGISTTQELTRCKKTVLIFYLNFLKLIGWRRWRGARHDLATPLYTNILNLIYPSFIFLLMLLACVTQLLTCFYRDQVEYTPKGDSDILVVECHDHIVTRTVVGDTLLLVAYVCGVYLFRYGEPEHLSALMERVYLSFNFKHRVSPQSRLTFVLRMFLTMAAVWVLLSLAGSILRLLSLKLLADDTYLSFITSKNFSNLTNADDRHSLGEEIMRYTFVIYSIFGFILFDLLYVAVVLTYMCQAQLLLTYINSVIDKVQTKAYDLGKAIRDMQQIYEYLKVLNGKLATLTSLCLFIFISSTISSLVGLTNSPKDNLPIAVGVVNFTQWSLLAVVPLIQAARLTSHCRKLRRLGLEVGARPFSYHDTPQLVLDSFLQYTNATRYTAKLASVPIYPAYVFAFFFLLAILATWSIATFTVFPFASWL